MLQTHTDWVFQLRRIKVDRQGYDSMGSYWGTGAKLWEVTKRGDYTENARNGFEYTSHIRANSLAEAKLAVNTSNPQYRYVLDVYAR